MHKLGLILFVLMALGFVAHAEYDPFAPLPRTGKSAARQEPDEFVETSIPAHSGVKIRFSLGPELGYALSDLGKVDEDNKWTSVLSNWGWAGITEDHESNKSTNASVGIVGKMEIDIVSVALGYRSVNLGSVAAVAKGTYYGGQYINLKESYSGNYTDTFFQIGLFTEFGSPKDLKASLQIELGYESGKFSDEIVLTGYNYSVIDSNGKIAGSSNTLRKAVLVGFEYDFLKHFGAALGAGYQFIDFTLLKVDAVSGTFPSSYKKGDTIKDANGGDAEQNLSGGLVNFKIFLLF